MKLSLIFPAYNEEGSIAGVLERFLEYCVSANLSHEIIVVNDGSIDATSEKVTEVARAHQTVRLIEHSQNQGYGAALRSGFEAATGDFIFFTDGDGQFSPDDLDQTLPRIDTKAIVLGYRKHRTDGMVRSLNARLWGRSVQLVLGVRVRDVNCAWKLFPRTLLSETALISSGAFINAELLYYARKKKLEFRQISVHHFARRSGIPTGASPKVIYRAFRELAQFRYHRDRRSVTH